MSAPPNVVVFLDDVERPEMAEVGALAREGASRAEVYRFSYGPGWLAEGRAYALDRDLPLSPGDFFAGSGAGIFGVFRDTSPDRWGRVLMERREVLDARREHRKPRRLSEWDFLVGVSDETRLGALRLRHPTDLERWLDDHKTGVPPMARLRELQAGVAALEDPDNEDRPEYESWLRLILAPGSSLGGARPKATFATPEGALWIAKFPGHDDRYDVGAWEYLTHALAREAKITVPDAQKLYLSGPHHTFAVHRFDREGSRRRLYASALTVIGASEGDAASYLDVAQAIQDVGDPESLADDLEELYRRVVFNVLVGNRDDHLRNHGFLRGRRGFRLAPAFDVNPNLDRAEHVLALDDSAAEPSIAAVRATAEFYRLRSERAEAIVAEVRAALTRWRTIAKTQGLKRGEIERLASVIDPDRE